MMHKEHYYLKDNTFLCLCKTIIIILWNCYPLDRALSLCFLSATSKCTTVFCFVFLVGVTLSMFHAQTPKFEGGFYLLLFACQERLTCRVSLHLLHFAIFLLGVANFLPSAKVWNKMYKILKQLILDLCAGKCSKDIKLCFSWVCNKDKVVFNLNTRKNNFK